MNLSKLREIVEDRGAWWVTVHGVAESQTLSDWTVIAAAAAAAKSLRLCPTLFNPRNSSPPSLAHFLIGSFVFLVLSCRSCLYIFEISYLSVASFAIIFSHSEGCLFTVLIVSFVVQKLLILIRSHLFIFAFISNILGGGSQRILLWCMSECFAYVLL